MKDVSETLKLEAVKYNGKVIRYIDYPTEEMKLLAISLNPKSIID